MPCFGCHLSPSSGYTAMVRTAKGIDADTFQFFTRNPRGSRAKKPDIKDISQAAAQMRAQSFGAVVAHGSYTMNLCTESPENRASATQLLREDLRLMSMLPGHFYNFHPGSHVGQGVQAGVTQIATALVTVLLESPPVTILLETMSGKGSEIGGRFEELRMILDATASVNVGVCLDTCHVWDAGYNLVDGLDGVLEEFDRIIGLNRLKAIHINDSKNPLGSHKDRHACLGDGFIGLDAIARMVSHPALKSLPMILETPNDLDGYAHEIALLRSFI